MSSFLASFFPCKPKTTAAKCLTQACEILRKVLKLPDSSLETFIAEVRAISSAKDPTQARATLRDRVLERVEKATTPPEKLEAYEYYKAFHELQPYISEEI